MEERKGWFKQPKEHGLAARGIPTKKREETLTRIPTKTKKPTYKLSKTSVDEKERILALFSDYNYKYHISPSFNNEGIYISDREAYDIMREAVPNGCGIFDAEMIKKLDEAYRNRGTFLIRRDEDGGVMVSVKGEPVSHPGAIREWLNANIVTVDNGITTYKWDPAPRKAVSPEKLSRDDKQLLDWAEEVKTGQTDLSFPEWVRSGEL